MYGIYSTILFPFFFLVDFMCMHRKKDKKYIHQDGNSDLLLGGRIERVFFFPL